MKEALTIALAIETAIRERGSFDSLAIGSVRDFDHLFFGLVADTRHHSETLYKELSRKRWRIF